MTAHRIRRHVQPATHGHVVTLDCDCGTWRAMTMAHGDRSIDDCTAELLAHRGDAHGPDVFEVDG